MALDPLVWVTCLTPLTTESDRCGLSLGAALA